MVFRRNVTSFNEMSVSCAKSLCASIVNLFTAHKLGLGKFVSENDKRTKGLKHQR